MYDTWAPRPCWFRAVLTAEGFSHSPCRDWATMQASPAARPLCRLAKKQTSSTAAARKRHIRPREDLQEAVHELTRSSAMDEKKLQRRLPCCRIGTIRAPAPLPVQRSGQYTAGYPAYLLQAQVQRSPLLVSSSTLERGGGALPMNRACYNSDAEGGREESTHARGRCFPPRPASGLYKARNRATQANNGRALMGVDHDGKRVRRVRRVGLCGRYSRVLR